MPLTKIEGPSLGNVTISSITSNASFDSGTLFVDAANNVVGIGNTTPIHKLRVEGTTSVSGNVSIDADLVVTGNLTVSGTTVTVNSENVLIKDNLITLSSNVTGAPVLDAGIEVNRGTSANVTLKWNETSDLWQLTNDGTNYGNILTTLSSTGVNASALSTGTVPLARLTSANSSANGVVDTTTQTFAGLKTFNSNATFSGSRTFFASGSVLDWNSGDVTLTHSANTLTFAGASSGYIFSDGNVGIGVTPSAWSQGTAFEMYQTGYGLWNGSGNPSSIYVLANSYFNGGFKYANSGGQASSYYQYQGEHVWSTAPSGTAGNAITFTERMRIDNSGNVGIGVTPSAWDSARRVIQIGGSGSLWTNTSGNGFLFLTNNAYYDGTNHRYLNTDEASYYAQTTAGVHSFATAASGTAGNTITFTERFHIDNSGNVGIGMTPSYRLDITGSAGAVVARFNQANAGKTGVMFAENGTQRAFLSQVGLYSGTTDGNFGIFVETGYNFQIATNGSVTSKFTVHTGGDVAIGATAKLYFDGTAGTGDSYLSEAGANVIRVTVGGVSAVQWDTTGMYLNTAPPTSASAANAVVGSGSDYLRRSTSSIRYKHDIDTLDATDAVSAVMAMRPVTYRGKTDEDQRRHIGFIAEEMQEIAPLLCTYDEGGESGTPNYVTYDRVTAYLVAVVQQQQQKIAALEARLATLEG